jgi:hypothetical protein
MDGEMTFEEILGTPAFKNALIDNARFSLVLALKGEPYSWVSEAVIAKIDDEFEISAELKADGFVGLLDFFDISDLWLGISQKKISNKQVADFLIHYAEFDAQPDWFNLLANKE